MSYARTALLAAALLSTGVASAQIVAYTYPSTSGNQWNFSGSLGMDFDVNAPIDITALGIFDSSQNGLQNDMNTHLYNRETGVRLASVSWSPSQQGYGFMASQFRNLAAPIRLEAGFKGSIVAEGFGVLEPNGNSNLPNVNFATQLNDGGGVISFTGKSRYGDFGAFPTNLDVAVAKYGAGNFRYQPVPEPAGFIAAGLGLLALLRRRSGTRTSR